MDDIYNNTGITATAGIGTNLYLTKVALDITAKHVKSHIGYLDEEKYKKELWHHTPLTDFWQIGRGMSERLYKLKLKDMYDIAHVDERILYKEFGVNAKYLIDHSKGIEPCTIKDIKDYKPKHSSICNQQVLFKYYNYIDARLVLTEMIDSLVCELVSKKKYTNVIGIYIGYKKDTIKGLKVSKKLEQPSNSYTKILNELLKEYDFRVNEEVPIKRLGVWFHNIVDRKVEQLDIFGNYIKENNDTKIEEVINNIKDKYGKNSILRAVSYCDNSTQKERNKLIGGHNAE